MSVAITIQLSPQALAIAQKWKDQPQQFPRTIQKSMTRSLQIVSGRIQLNRLTGHGPFPVEEHRLGERTGQLKLQTRSTPAKIVNDGEQSTIEGAIGSSVEYAGYNEFGTSRTPERAPFRTGINENMKYIADEMTKDVIESFKHDT